jgi:hypothetical protein
MQTAKLNILFALENLILADRYLLLLCVGGAGPFSLLKKVK